MKWLLVFNLALSSLVHAGSDKDLNLDKRLKAFCKNVEKKQASYMSERKIKTSTKKKRRSNKKRRKSHSGCKMTNNWIAELKDTLCNGKKVKSFNNSELMSINIPENLLFYIAGASDFNAEMINKQINPNNLNGTEGNDLQGLNWSGPFLMDVFKQFPSFRRSTELNYYAGSGFKSKEGGKDAKVCIEDSHSYTHLLADLINDKSVIPNFILMGYSNGGELAIDFQEELGDDGVSLDLVIAIDPVVQAIKYPFTSSDGFMGKKHSKTKRLLSIFQRDDYGSLKGFKLRGKPVENADRNLKVSARNSREMRHDGLQNHMKILKSRLTIETVLIELENLDR